MDLITGSRPGPDVVSLRVAGGPGTLERRTAVVLVPLADGRALISFKDSKTIEQISSILRDARRSKAVAVQRRNIIETVHRARRRRTAGPLPTKSSRRMSS